MYMYSTYIIMLLAYIHVVKGSVTLQHKQYRWRINMIV